MSLPLSRTGFFFLFKKKKQHHNEYRIRREKKKPKKKINGMILSHKHFTFLTIPPPLNDTEVAAEFSLKRRDKDQRWFLP